MAITKQHLLLIDLDGVLVVEAEPPAVPSRELLLLHENLHRHLAGMAARKVILTHRSRREAGAILKALRLEAPLIEGYLAAEDLFAVAWREVGAFGLFRGGLRKSAMLGALEDRLSMKRTNFAIIDDNRINIDGMLAHGIGLALHAPIGLAGGELISFDWSAADKALVEWSAGSPQALVSLPEVNRPLERWQSTGIHTRREGQHLFNAVRLAGHRLRRAFGHHAQ